jgi:hypothetical protein
VCHTGAAQPEGTVERWNIRVKLKSQAFKNKTLAIETLTRMTPHKSV